MERTAPDVEEDPVLGDPATRPGRRSPRWWRHLRARTRAVRARVRRTTVGRVGWRIGVGVVGGLLLVVGVVAIPGPGQGWALVFLALAILSTEFRWANRARTALWVRLVRARRAYAAMSPARRALVVVGLVLLVAVCLAAAWWVSLLLAGIPGWVPSPAADLLDRVPGVD
ncbi:PGPGW domain-containing protein [Aquipuribacter hungaricus]|uniref:PGPGW domain-containing protein n=1 Tax=Aquipuribacter hungaricus TaxID=545624 RepID=A0ABV7WD69_9MICO